MENGYVKATSMRTKTLIPSAIVASVRMHISSHIPQVYHFSSQKSKIWITAVLYSPKLYVPYGIVMALETHKRAEGV